MNVFNRLYNCTGNFSFLLVLGQDERLLRPIVVDLESDGISEIVIVTAERHLEVLDIEKQQTDELQ